MTYEIRKKIKGRLYRYLVKGVREGKKVKLKFVKYLGPVNPVNKTQKKKGGRKPGIFVRQLTVEEKQRLATEQQNNQAFVRDRAKIVLFSSEGRTPKEIAAQLRMGYLRILKVIHSFNKTGLEFFKKGKPTGRRRRISREQENDLIGTALKSPKDAGLIYNNWSCRLLCLWFKEKYDQEISDEWIRILLRRNRVTFTMPKHKLLKAEPRLQASFKKN